MAESHAAVFSKVCSCLVRFCIKNHLCLSSLLLGPAGSGPPVPPHPDFSCIRSCRFRTFRFRRIRTAGAAGSGPGRAIQENPEKTGAFSLVNSRNRAQKTEHGLVPLQDFVHHDLPGSLEVLEV